MLRSPQAFLSGLCHHVHVFTRSPKKHWEAVYSQSHPGELSWHQERPALSLELVAAAGLDADARILDVGGGTSNFVDHLLDLGFHNVDVLDISEPAIRHAQARLGRRASRVRWHVREVTTFTTGHRFDLWHDRAVLHFLTRKSDRERYACALEAAVKPRGHVIISTFSLDGPRKCSGLRVRRYGPEEISALLGSRFDLVDTRRETHLTPGGAVGQRFSYFRLHGRGDTDD